MNKYVECERNYAIELLLCKEKIFYCNITESALKKAIIMRENCRSNNALKFYMSATLIVKCMIASLNFYSLS